MSLDLVSTIMGSLSSESVGRIASGLGLDNTATQRGIAAAVPAVLAGLANSASTSGGALRIARTLSETEELPEGDIAQSMVEAASPAATESGWTAMSSLIGAGPLEAIAAGVAQFAGFGQGPAKKLLGFLVPLIFGFLKREQSRSGLDGKGMASLLASQRSNFERAMPASVARRLQEANTRPTTRQMPVSAGYRQPPAGQSSRSWAYWLLPALIVAGAAIYLLPERDNTRTAQEINQTTTSGSRQAPAKEVAHLPQAAQPAPVTTSAVTPPATPSTEATLESDILANISQLRAALQSVKDPASAQAAMGEIKAITERFSRLKSIAQQLSPESRKALAAAIANRVPDLNGLIDRLGSETNFGGEAKPTMDNLQSELASLSKA
jgi:hypothetical protein